MPNKPKTRATTFRFTPEELALMDRLGAALAPPGLPPFDRTAVLRMALAKLAAANPGAAEAPAGVPAPAEGEPPPAAPRKRGRPRKARADAPAPAVPRGGRKGP
jgi:hypothetical protein